MIRLGVNIDHVATVRNARGGAHPDPVDAAMAAIAAGADGITAHLREDRRHIRDADIDRLRATITVPLNLEMAATDEMVANALRVRPNACCIVPERRAEVTTEGGLDAAGQTEALRPMVAGLRAAGIRVSLFIDPDERQLQAAADLRADIVELHTGAYAEGQPGELDRLRRGAALTAELGLECHAGPRPDLRQRPGGGGVAGGDGAEYRPFHHRSVDHRRPRRGRAPHARTDRRGVSVPPLSPVRHGSGAG